MSREDLKKMELYLSEEKQKYLKSLKEPKLLILGTSDAGKSTFLKQLKIIHGSGFTEDEMRQTKQSAITQVLNAAEIIIKNSDENIKSTYKIISQYIYLVAGPYDCLPLNIINLLATMWDDPIIQKRFEELSHLIPRSTSHFLLNIKRIAFAQSVLNNEDILLQRTETQTITETTFISENHRVHFYDVSGLKHHRKLWIPYFQDVLMIIFIVDVSAYDMMMAEAPETNRMVDALNLFDEIANHKLLKNVDISLFFNKKDLFENKVFKVPVSDFFPNYNGEAKNPKAAGAFFQDLFLKKQRSESRRTTVSFTCCTDSKLIQKLSTKILVSISKKALTESGL